MSRRTFVILDKGFADQSQHFSFRDFVKHGTALLVLDHKTHEDAAEWYAEHRAESWEWNADEPHEFLVGDNTATCLKDLHVVTVTKVVTVHHQTSTKGTYERRAERAGRGDQA